MLDVAKKINLYLYDGTMCLNIPKDPLFYTFSYPTISIMIGWSVISVRVRILLNQVAKHDIMNGHDKTTRARNEHTARMLQIVQCGRSELNFDVVIPANS